MLNVGESRNLKAFIWEKQTKNTLKAHFSVLKLSKTYDCYMEIHVTSEMCKRKCKMCAIKWISGSRVLRYIKVGIPQTKNTIRSTCQTYSAFSDRASHYFTSYKPIDFRGNRRPGEEDWTPSGSESIRSWTGILCWLDCFDDLEKNLLLSPLTITDSWAETTFDVNTYLILMYLHKCFQKSKIKFNSVII